MCQYTNVTMQRNYLTPVFIFPYAPLQSSNFDPSGCSPAELRPICFIVCRAKVFEDLRVVFRGAQEIKQHIGYKTGEATMYSSMSVYIYLFVVFVCF